MMKRLSAWYAECSQSPFGSITIRALPSCANVSIGHDRRVEVGDVDPPLEVARHRRPAGSRRSAAGPAGGCRCRRCCRKGRRRCGLRRCVRDGSRRRAARAAGRRRAPRRSAATGAGAACASAVLLSASVTSTSLPSTFVSNVCGLFRLNTTRVRLPAWTTLQAAQRRIVDGALVARRARSPCRGNRARSAAGWRSRTRPADWPAAPSARSARSCSPEAPRVTVTCSMLLDACASAAPAAASAANPARRAIHALQAARPPQPDR